MKPPITRNQIEEQRAKTEVMVEGRFPVRGWFLEKSITPDPSDKRWPLYAILPLTNEEGIIVGEPQVLEHLKSARIPPLLRHPGSAGLHPPRESRRQLHNALRGAGNSRHARRHRPVGSEA